MGILKAFSTMHFCAILRASISMLLARHVINVDSVIVVFASSSDFVLFSRLDSRQLFENPELQWRAVSRLNL